MSARVVVCAGGGTGGHIFPNLAVAAEVRRLCAERGEEPPVCVFAVSERAIDAKILKEAGERFVAVPARPVVVGKMGLGLVRFAASWGPAVRAARRMIAEARAAGGAGGAVTVVATGGFVSAPVARAAQLERARVVLVNLDAAPGKANRWIARRADACFTTAGAWGGWRRVPPIVRAGAVSNEDKSACRRAFGLDEAGKTLLVTGGSQGARSVNQCVTRVLSGKPEAARGWQVVHQCGAGELESVREAYARANVRAFVAEFIGEIGRAWGAADAAVGRAGAGTVAEAWANAVPTLFLPYPWHADEHQKFNALPMVEAGAALLAKDLIEAEKNAAGEAGQQLVRLLTDASLRQELRRGLAELGPADGAARVAAEVMRG